MTSDRPGGAKAPRKIPRSHRRLTRTNSSQSSITKGTTSDGHS